MTAPEGETEPPVPALEVIVKVGAEVNVAEMVWSDITFEKVNSETAPCVILSTRTSEIL